MPNRRASTVRTRPGQKRTTRPNSRAIRPRSARARQLKVSVLNLCWYRPSVLMDASSLDRFLLSWYFCVGARDRIVDRGVELRTKQHHRSADVEVEQQTHGGPEAPVGEAEVGEVGQVEGKGQRGDRPQHYGEGRAQGYRTETLPGVGTETVDRRK